MTTFAANDKVLAFHGPLLYVAKVIEVDVQGAEPRYFIHYEGWKRKWDEWVPENRLLPDTPENQEKLRHLGAESKQAKRAAASSKRAKTEATKDDGSGEQESAEDENPFEDAAVKIVLPHELKVIVVKDWENLTQKGLVLKLPSAPTVAEILKMFMSDRQRKPIQAFAQVIEGLGVYFDRALPTILLYKVERAQLAKVQAEMPGKRFVDIYGGEHLLRLFVRLPHLLAHADIGESDLALLLTRLQELFKFLVEKQSECFSKDAYVAAPLAAANEGDDNDDEEEEEVNESGNAPGATTTTTEDATRAAAAAAAE